MVVGVVSSLIGSALWFAIGSTGSRVHAFVLGKSHPIVCNATKIPSNNLEVYQWNITIPFKSRSIENILITTSKDMFIIKDSMAINSKSISLSKKIGEHEDGSFYGGIYRVDQFSNEDSGSINFKVMSNEHLRRDTCENFIILF